MDARQTWTDRDEARDYVVPNVLSPRDLVSRPNRMDETVLHTLMLSFSLSGLSAVVSGLAFGTRHLEGGGLTFHYITNFLGFNFRGDTYK